MILSDGLNYLQRNAGRTFRVRYFTSVAGSVWDDESVWSQSGTDFYTSGVILNIDSKQGSEDQVLLDQGRIRFNDSKIYVNGSLQTTSGLRIFTVAISGLNRVFIETDLGAYMPTYLGADIFKKIYCRELPTGSLATGSYAP